MPFTKLSTIRGDLFRASINMSSWEELIKLSNDSSSAETDNQFRVLKSKRTNFIEPIPWQREYKFIRFRLNPKKTISAYTVGN